MDSTISQQKHFILVHGTCHGAWCWYKLKPMLEAAGHRVTAIDMAACGINPKKIEELFTLDDLSVPLMELMDAIPENEKVILVGHSYGGLNLALAMDKYPQKISVSVFLAAVMPDTIHPPATILDRYFEKIPENHLFDTQLGSYGSEEKQGHSIFFGPQFLTEKLYQNCSKEDIELAKMLVRPFSMFHEDISKRIFSNEGYGSVKRVYISIDQDCGLPVELQNWIVENIGATEAKVIKDADHMAMLSNPKQLSQFLLEIPQKYN